MLTDHQHSFRNLFLETLGAPDFGVLRSHLSPVVLRPGERLHHRGESVDDVYFPHSGLVVMTIPDGDGDAGAALGPVGREGIIGSLAASASAPATCDAEVFVGGQGSRMSAMAFRHVLEQRPSIRRHAARFDSAMLVHTQHTALCNAVHPAEGRICRWLLEFQDRVGSTKVYLTQATLAQMLGVRRTTVTLLAGRLEAAGVIVCGRGAIQIVSRSELERRSCACHSQVKHYMDLLLAPADSVATPSAATGERASSAASGALG